MNWIKYKKVVGVFGMQLSVCIITKNEQQNIARCLESLMPYGFEIVVTDTGSTDKTKETVLKYTDNLYDFEWCNDFAAAKNFAVSKATNPYVMILDSDEYIEVFDENAFERVLKEYPDCVGRIKIRNFLTRDGIKKVNEDWINRIFCKEKFCYEGCIHEQIVSKEKEDYDTFEAPVVIGHTGYDLSKEERKQKANRNKELLEQELQILLQERNVASVEEDASKSQSNDMENKIPYILYQLGKSYFMAEDYTQSCQYFARGLSYDLNPKLEYVIDMVETYGYALINSGQAQEALFFENIYEEFGKTADFQFLMGLIYMNNARFEDAVNEFLKATTHKECRNVGVNSFSAFYNVGVIYECLGQWDKAKEYYEKCDDYEPAQNRLMTNGRVCGQK